MARKPSALRRNRYFIGLLQIGGAEEGEVLINSLDAAHTGPDLTRAAYSKENYRRLVALKDKYDPANVFHFNHNIAPSKGQPSSR